MKIAINKKMMPTGGKRNSVTIPTKKNMPRMASS
jgi:hypothetical protein